jgi:oligopeptide transport system ATP-binding protein
MLRKILEVKNLETSFYTYAGEVKAVDDVSFYVEEGETIAIVGESGCGKTATCQSVMRLIPSPPGKIKNGQIIFDGQNLMELSESQMEQIRGNKIGMIFQDPMTSLNPVLTLGLQLTESLRKHKKMGKQQAAEKAVGLLTMVGIPNAKLRLNQYPHQLSGGMRQRVMIAMAVSCQPKLLIADEPTTALDVTIQAQILDLMNDLKQKANTSTIIITHDLGMVARMAKRILVMYAGKIIESGATENIYYRPRHPYTIGLLSSVPRLDDEHKSKLTSISGQPPDLLSPPEGCAFYARCRYGMKICQKQKPQDFFVGDGHMAGCWLHHPLAPKGILPEGRLKMDA